MTRSWWVKAPKVLRACLVSAGLALIALTISSGVWLAFATGRESSPSLLVMQVAPVALGAAVLWPVIHAFINRRLRIDEVAANLVMYVFGVLCVTATWFLLVGGFAAEVEGGAIAAFMAVYWLGFTGFPLWYCVILFLCRRKCPQFDLLEYGKR